MQKKCVRQTSAAPEHRDAVCWHFFLFWRVYAHVFIFWCIRDTLRRGCFCTYFFPGTRANTYLKWVVATTDDARTQVLLSGGSAGGLSTYLHADYVRSQFAETVKFKAAPISGFFLNHATAAGVPDYINKMKWVFE